MRTKTLKSGFIFILISLFFSCQTKNPSPFKGLKDGFSEKKSPGKIVFDTEIHNFGTLNDGEVVAYSFKFKNIGGNSFRITKSENSCGCITVKYGQGEVLPGDSAYVSIIFNTSGEWGNQFKGAVIETSEGEKKDLQIGAYINNKQFNNLLNTEK